MTAPLVLVHGLWDTPRLFRRLIQTLDEPDRPLLAPHLPHRMGAVPLRRLAEDLDTHIQARFGNGTTIDLFGFSMGGVVSRIWLQECDGARRTRRFFSVGSPQHGTLAAQLIPRALVAGAADMKVGSALLRDLNRSSGVLKQLDCRSYACCWDVMVFPYWTAFLAYGERRLIDVFTHQQLISHPRALQIFRTDLLAV